MFDPSKKCVIVEPSSSMQQCIDTYGIEGEGEFVNNSISLEAQFWTCGMISRKGRIPKHDHDPKELARCHALANEAAALMGPFWNWLRSSADPVTEPFFVAAQCGAAFPAHMSETVIRNMFGGTLHPEASVVIEPLEEGTRWWREIEEDVRSDLARGQPDTKFDNLVQEWRNLMKWFRATDFVDPSFVRITDSVKPCLTLGCVFPCFLLGISKGSLIGISTHVVE